MTVLALLAALAAMALLGHAADYHIARRALRPCPRRRQRLRGGAAALLLTAFVLCLGARGPVFGPIVWFALVMFAAGCTFLVINHMPLPAAAPARRTSR